MPGSLPIVLNFFVNFFLLQIGALLGVSEESFQKFKEG
jgi:hypothetical protein